MGRFQLRALSLGSYWPDGGSVYGGIAKATWSRITPADTENRVEMALRALLLVEDDSVGAGEGGGGRRSRPGRRILIDTGMGSALQPARAAELNYIPPAGGMAGALEPCGVTPEQITDVVLTHLHIDHAGGAISEAEDGTLVATFPNATVHVQRRALKWSGHATERDAAWFDGRISDVLARAGCLHLLDGPAELFEGISVSLSEGHTVGQQLPLIEAGDQKLLVCGDVIPTRAHLRPTWISAEDLYPLTSLEEKKLILAEALDEEWSLFFCHDAAVAACLLSEREGEVVDGAPVVF